MLKEIDYNSKILIGSTVVSWKCDKNEHLEWLKKRKEIKRIFPNSKFFASLELDSRKLNPFLELLEQVKEVDGEYWTFTINDKRPTVSSQNRWIRMETGRNLIREFAQMNTWPEDSRLEKDGPVVNYDGILFIDSDIELTVSIMEKMLSVDNYLVGVEIPEYELGDNPSIAMMLINAPEYFDLPFYDNRYQMINDDKKFIKEAERKFGKTYLLKNIKLNKKHDKNHVEHRNISDRSFEDE
jgi:hypothetical protein